MTARFYLFTTLLFAAVHFAVAQSSLRIDFNYRTADLPAQTQEGYDAFVIGSIGGSGALQTGTNTFQFGSLTISAWRDGGNGLDDRRRTSVVNNGSFTNAPMLQDFVFNQGATTTGSGLSLLVQGLVSNQTYQFTVWSYDYASTGNRVSDWYANGVLVKNNYSFNGAVLPASNTDYRFIFNATANANGEILIQGKRDSTSVDSNGAVATAVFLNAMEIANIPDQSPPCGTLVHFKPGSNLYGWTGGSTFEEQNQEVALLKEAGAQWARINVVWYAVEPNGKGSYDQGLLALYDNLMARLAENGIKAIFVTADTPYWASADPAKTPGNWLQKYKPSNFSDLADYYVFLLNRYRSTGPHVFEIWNEEDVSYFWPSGVNAADYAAMLQTCYTAIKAADPQAIVLNGGLTDTSSTTNYIAALYAAGAKNYFDAWSQHTYTKTPQYETIVSKVRNLMVANGDSAKKIWITECGWLTATNGESGAVSHDRQAHYLTNFFTRLGTYPYVETVLWYTSRSYDENTHEGSFGLLLPDFTKKPSYYAYKDWVSRAGIYCPSGPITVSAPAYLTNGIFHLGFTGTAGASYSIHVSTNLAAWTPIVTNLSSAGTAYSWDVPAPSLRNQFYRVSSP